jgi:hypothetical protein
MADGDEHGEGGGPPGKGYEAELEAAMAVGDEEALRCVLIIRHWQLPLPAALSSLVGLPVSM